MSVLIIALLLFLGTAVAKPGAAKACSDKIDNDNDGYCDFTGCGGLPADPGCSSRQDATETNAAVQCDDGVDNGDADLSADSADAGCSGPRDNDESNGVCDDGADSASDADALADYPKDLGCASFSDTGEVDGDCDDLVDNDGDTYADYPIDLGCNSYTDAGELGTAECDDGVDNDGDTAADYPLDAGCAGSVDADETNCGDSVCEGGEVCDACASDCGHCDSCSESDLGFVDWLFGTISGYLGGSPYYYEDYCADSTTLVEYYCMGSSAYHADEICAGNYTGCADGACY